FPKGIWAPVLALIAAGALWWPRPAPEHVEPFRKTPLTSYPGSELQPTFSPDGRQVAFAWNGPKRDNFDIYVKLVDGGDPLPLTQDPSNDRLPRWSPDGRFIAFARGAAIYLISPLGGVERKVADATPVDIAWTPDGKSIAFNDQTPAGYGPVNLLNLE